MLIGRELEVRSFENDLDGRICSVYAGIVMDTIETSAFADKPNEGNCALGGCSDRIVFIAPV